MDEREFHEAVCWKCKRPAAWLVYESSDPHAEWLMTCIDHKLEAFS